MLNSSVLKLLFAVWDCLLLFLFAPRRVRLTCCFSLSTHDHARSVVGGSSEQVIKGVRREDKGTKSRTIAHTAAALFSFKGHCGSVRERVCFTHKGSPPDPCECVFRRAKSCVLLFVKPWIVRLSLFGFFCTFTVYKLHPEDAWKNVHIWFTQRKNAVLIQHKNDQKLRGSCKC